MDIDIFSDIQEIQGLDLDTFNDTWKYRSWTLATSMITGRSMGWTLIPLYLMIPGTVGRVMNSQSATSEHSPSRLLSRVDFPTDGKPTNPTEHHLSLPHQNLLLAHYYYHLSG